MFSQLSFNTTLGVKARYYRRMLLNKKDMDESGGNRGGRGSGRRIWRGRYSRRPIGRHVLIELHNAAITFLRNAVMAALPPDQRQSVPEHLHAILQELNEVVFRSLEYNLPRVLHDLVQNTVLEALKPYQGQGRQT